MTRTIFIIISREYATHQIYWVDHTGGPLGPKEIQSITPKIIDTVDQQLFINMNDHLVEYLQTLGSSAEVVCFRPGVTDNPAKSFAELLTRDPAFSKRRLEVHSGVLKLDGPLKHNPLIENKFQLPAVEDVKQLSDLSFALNLEPKAQINEINLMQMDDEALLKASQENCWALSLPEMQAIQSYFNSASVQAQRQQVGLPAAATDVEIEMLALTWSEHCKHKIFNARIHYQDEEQSLEIESLFKDYIKQPTYDLDLPWAISVFDDNAGIVRFREDMDVCIKVETHNSPSALDPYGGALTGILGVNRDIMGTGLGAKPVANTNVFCVGMPDEKNLPPALIHPRDILKGIHRGVMDGGNKSGIPTINGAIYFDRSYSGKPLVYCGTVGMLPPRIQERPSSEKGQRPGDLIVMVGGAVGMDGIHGATASSLVMDKNTTIGMVQIGDPFTQKRVLDFLLAARDQLLYNSLTDNGAGGLSSSVGEMAEATGGACLELDTVPLKYPGLMPWQILVSESQERMTLSVPKENWSAMQELAKVYQVEVTRVGEFTANGRFSCKYQGKTVCELDLDFLHKGLPKLELKARFESTKTPVAIQGHQQFNPEHIDHNTILSGLLAHPVLSSKEPWVRQYDHEVQGATVVKPFEGLDASAPNDAGVIWYGAHGVDGLDGVAVASGLCPHFSQDDTYLMAKLAVDEAVRNLLCHGVDPDKVALVDNFCWPDPIASSKNPDGEFKLAQLVRSCMGLREMVQTYGMPLVSGKDSMKNDYHGEDCKISVRPTLLVTAMGHVPDVTTGLKSHACPGHLLYRLGHQDYQQYFGHFLHQQVQLERRNCRDFHWQGIRQMYQQLFDACQSKLVSSLHDISEGGMLVALFETLLLHNGGIEFELEEQHDELAWAYSELPGHFVVSIAPEAREQFEAAFGSQELQYLGVVNTSGLIKFGEHSMAVSEMARYWRGL